MRTVTLVLIVHDHQPVGNFDGVFAEAYRQAYAPFLEFLEGHPRMRLALHTSGPLLQWIAHHRPDYLKRLRRLAERDQVELWGGGFFEPVLPAIPEADRRGQIRAMADWLELELGRRPRGLWLAERAWEPGLASSLAGANVDYAAVDDAHFVAAGFEREALWGYYLTEDQGLSLAMFPIHRELRYLIPFDDPEKTVELLSRVREGGDRRIAVLGDDGEKFGLWPGTHTLVYRRGWLARFAAALEAHPWIELRTPGEALAHHPPLGLAYLPTASYHEMEEWTLPPAAQARYHRAAELLEPAYRDGAHDLLRGGHWRNFLARYPESNRMHKRMLRASHRLWSRAADREAGWQDARTHLWKAQCNDAYWHGVFGGLYLPMLRAAIYRELIEVESFLAPEAARVECSDFDLDGHPDAMIETKHWAAWISARGASLWALDDRATLVNYGDTMARRPELYHQRLRDARVGGGEGATIHAGVRLKQPGLARLVEEYDARARDSFLDRWDEPGATHDWAQAPFHMAADTAEASVTLEAAEGAGLGLTKRYRPDAQVGLAVEYTLRSSRPRRGRLIVELNLGLHVPEAEDRFVEIDGSRGVPPHFGARAQHPSVSRSAFVDRWADRRLEITTDRPASLERSPIETVSLSEDGAERVFQGIELRYGFELTLDPDHPVSLRFALAASLADGA